MDNELNKGKQRHRRRKGWAFTFVGETAEKRNEGGNRTKYAPELTQNELKIDRAFPLSATQVGDRVIINQILSGKNTIHSLSNMGLTLGSEVQVISKTKSGSVIVCTQDEQIGLDAGMANQVMVAFIAGKS